MTKNFKYFFIFLFLLSCGYTPIYQIKKDSNFKIDTINFSGDKNIGREIIRGLKNFEGNDAKNIFDLDINTSKTSKYCMFRRSGIKYVDYKDPDFLNRFINEQGKILPRRLTGTSLKYQRKVSTAVKRARHLALLPYVGDLLK